MTQLLLASLLLLAPPQDSVQKLVRDILSDDSRARSSAYMALQRTRPSDALPMLVQGVHEAPLMGQYYALLVIGRYPAGDVGKAMKSLAESKSPFVAFSASAYLYRAGQRSYLKPVLRSFDAGKSDAAVLERMVMRIAYLDISELHKRLVALVDVDLETKTLDSILYSLARLPYRPALARVNVILAVQSIGLDRKMICHAFAVAVGDASHEKALIGGLDRSSALDLTRVQKFLGIAPGLGDDLLSAIGEMLRSVDSGHQLATWIRLLAKHGKPSVAKWIQPMVEHKDSVAAKAAVKALVDLRKIDVAALRRLLSGARKDLVLVAADTLRRMDDPSGLPRVLEIARSSHSKYEMVAVLVGFRSKQVVPVLIDLLEDSNQTVRSRASAGLLANLRALYPFRHFDLGATGYEASGSASTRKEAVARIRAWWLANL